MYKPNLGKLDRCFISTKILVLTVDSIKRLYYIHSVYTNINSMTDVIKDAFLMIRDLNSVFLWASFTCVYLLLTRMKIPPSLAFGNNCDKVIQRCRHHQVYSSLLLTAMHSSVRASTLASCLLSPEVLGVAAHRGLVHGVPGCHGCLPACCCWFLEFQIVTVVWFTGF